jgi:hypothetical protein
VRRCDWNPADSDLEEIAQNTSTSEAICTKQKKSLPSSIARKTSRMMKL